MNKVCDQVKEENGKMDRKRLKMNTKGKLLN